MGFRCCDEVGENSSQRVGVKRKHAQADSDPLEGGAEVFCCGHWTLTTNIFLPPAVVASAPQRGERTVMVE